MWMTAFNFASTPLCPTPETGATIHTPYNRKLLRTEGKKMQRRGGWVAAKEIWLFNTKKTGMQGVNPLDGSSANKRPSSRQRLVRGYARGGGAGFPLPSGSFV